MSKKGHERPDIDFDEALTRGHVTYNSEVGEWWIERSNDPAHIEAYRNIAYHLRDSLKITPRRIVDYACGGGNLLVWLYEAFPKAELIAIDGSSAMLDVAQQRLAAIDPDYTGRVEFWESDLPNFELPKFDADLVIFCFPNICPNPGDQPYYDDNGGRHRADVKAARWLSVAREKDPEDETCFMDPSDMFVSLMDHKVVSRNLRKLIHDKGQCARVEYANAEWEELSDLVQWRLRFEQGSLGRKIDGVKPKQIFKVKSSTYFESEVILDVYHQTGDEGDMEGGFHVNLLKAVD